MKNDLKQMIRKIYFLEIFRMGIFYVPVLVIYFKFLLKDPSKVGILLVSSTISILIFEIPTGVISDRFSRKLSVLIGFIINIINLIIFITTTNFYLLCIAQIFYGIAVTFNTGSMTSLIYDNLKQMGETKRFQSLTKNLSLLRSIVLFSSFIIGGALYKVSPKLPFILTIIFIFLAFIVCLSIKEYSFKDEYNNDKKKNLKNKVSITNILSEPKHVLINICLVNVIDSIFYAYYLFLMPLILKRHGIGTEYYGIIMSLAVLFFGFGGKFSGIIKNQNKFLSFTAPILGALLFLVAIIFPYSLVNILLLFFIRLIWGGYTTIYTIYINNNIENSGIRSTVISIGSAIQNGLSGLLILFLGFFIRTFTFENALLFTSVLLILSSFSFVILNKKYKFSNFKKEINNSTT